MLTSIVQLREGNDKHGARTRSELARSGARVSEGQRACRGHVPVAMQSFSVVGRLSDCLGGLSVWVVRTVWAGSWL
jgi:hypothetical protein